MRWRGKEEGGAGADDAVYAVLLCSAQQASNQLAFLHITSHTLSDTAPLPPPSLCSLLLHTIVTSASHFSATLMLMLYSLTPA